MDKEEYQAKRTALMAEAKAAINAGDVEKAKEKREAVEKLDSDFEAFTKELANQEALEKRQVLNMGKKSVSIENGLEDEGMGDGKVDEKKLYENAFAKHLMGIAMSNDEQRVFGNVMEAFKQRSNEAITTKGVLVPETVLAGIWKEMGENHSIIADVGITKIPGAVSVIRNTVEGDDGEWYDEATVVADGALDFDKLELSGCELAKDITVTFKMKKMSIDAFIPYITSLIAEKMGNALANAFINGKGKAGNNDTFKDQPSGIITALTAEEHTPQIKTYTASMAYKDITGMFALLKSGYKTGAKVYARNTSIWNDLANIVNANGNPIFVPDPTGSTIGRLFGTPVTEEGFVPEGALLLANAGKGYAANANEDISINYEDHLKSRTTDYMGYALVDGGVITTKAFVLLKKSV
ncbi:MAG: phage major capsid protein [Acholeplasmataceae bacterium]|nr:phage major capsid protein [Acholeplasmataceae bacterium]